MKLNIFNKLALVSAMVMTTGVVSANAFEESSEDTSSAIYESYDSSSSFDHDRRRDRRRHRDHDRHRDRYRRDRYDYDTCSRNQPVYLVCKVNGRHENVTGYIDCGTGYEGSYCYNVDVPGYRILKMNVTYRCEYGRWQIQNMPGQGCKLSY